MINLISSYVGAMVVPTACSTVSGAVAAGMIGVCTIKEHEIIRKRGLIKESKASEKELKKLSNQDAFSWVVVTVILGAGTGCVIGSAMSGTAHTISLIVSTVL